MRMLKYGCVSLFVLSVIVRVACLCASWATLRALHVVACCISLRALYITVRVVRRYLLYTVVPLVCLRVLYVIVQMYAIVQLCVGMFAVCHCVARVPF